jgi:uncharacterized protein YidB (DUF937 family)
MGFLDDLLGGALGGGSIQQSGERRLGGRSPGSGGGMGGVMMALLPVVLSMLASRGGSRQGGGGLGDILGQVLAGAGQSSGSMGDDSMPGSRAGMGGGMGGLGALLEQMQQAGLGDQARSWVGTGENMPVSPDVLSQIFGDGGVGAIARQAGLTPKETSDGLSQLLPEVVNHVTPTGEVPAFDELTRSIDDLRQRMGG